MSPTQDELNVIWQNLLRGGPEHVANSEVLSARIVHNEYMAQTMEVEHPQVAPYGDDQACLPIKVNYHRTRRDKENNWGEWTSASSHA